MKKEGCISWVASRPALRLPLPHVYVVKVITSYTLYKYGGDQFKGSKSYSDIHSLQSIATVFVFRRSEVRCFTVTAAVLLVAHVNLWQQKKMK